MALDLAPIAIFAYNRRDNLERVFSALQMCNGFDRSPVIIFVDGPKSDKDRAQVEEVRGFVRSLNLPNIVEVVIRDKNMGLKDSIYDGVTKVCAQYGRIIVLEDDLILSPVALDYFNAALEKYKDVSRVWSVVGYQYTVPELEKTDRALVLPFTHTWGWATWQRAWGQYDMHAPVDEADLKSKSFKQAFDVYGIRDFRNMIVLALSNHVSCWFTPWYYKMFSEGGVSISPPQSYVENIGIKRGGTHASGLNPYYLLVKQGQIRKTMCLLPDVIKIDYWAIDAIKSSWDARVQRIISHLGRIKRLLFSCGRNSC